MSNVTIDISRCYVRSDNKNGADLEDNIKNSMEVLESNDITESEIKADNTESTNTEKLDDDTERNKDSDEPSNSTTGNDVEPVAPVKQKEVNIYSVDEISLDVVSAVGLVSEDTVLTPEIIVDMVVNAFADRLVTIGIDSVSKQDDSVIVSFKKDQAPLYNSGSTLESTILDAIAQSLVDNLKEYPKVIYRVENKPYESGHYAFELNEIYLDNTGKE